MEKAFDTYNGGKESAGTYQILINNIPKCDILIEAMAGNASIARRIKRPKLTVINDIDPAVIDKYNYDRSDIIFLNQCYSEVIKNYDSSQNAFFYFDPPYLFETRRSQQRLYNFEWTPTQHVEFLTMAVIVKSNCMISHYPCELYDRMLTGWRTHEFQSMTRQGLRTEKIYMNYKDYLY